MFSELKFEDGTLIGSREEHEAIILFRVMIFKVTLKTLNTNEK
jgi:hypothetical protein